MTKKNKKAIRVIVGVTVGGPVPGLQFQVDFNKKAHVILLPNDPFYCAAIYVYMPQLTALGEMIAVFKCCVERKK